MGWRSPLSSGPTPSRFENPTGGVLSTARTRERRQKAQRRQQRFDYRNNLHNDVDEDENGSKASSYEGGRKLTKKRLAWVIGMLGQIGVTVYFVFFLDPGKSINRGALPWTSVHQEMYDNMTRTNSSLNTTTMLPSLSPSIAPTSVPTSTQMTNVAEAFMLLEPLGLTLPPDAEMSWTVVTSSRIQQSILENERLSVFFVQTRIVQQTVVEGGEEEDGSSTPEGARRLLRQRQQRNQQQQRQLNANDALLIHFETTFFSGTWEKSALEQELLDAFADPERVEQYLLDLQRANSFFLFQALQDATVTLEFDQVTFPPSSTPSAIPTTTNPPSSLVGPSSIPSSKPTIMPVLVTPATAAPVVPPTAPPTTAAPQLIPTTETPSSSPSQLPTTNRPTSTPSNSPSSIPTSAPFIPTVAPVIPTLAPVTPTLAPVTPTLAPVTPTIAPVVAPTDSPSSTPTGLPLTILADFELLQEVPHSNASFTQGLEMVPNSNPLQYYESIGLYGEGAVQIVDLNSGVVNQQHLIADEEIFAFGLTKYSNQILQLTWRAGFGYIYDATTLAELGTFPINTTNGEGWGICHDTTVDTSRLFVSDGTTYLHTWDAATKALLGKVQVMERTDVAATELTPVRRVNELEWDRFTNTILANVWQKDHIIRIDPMTGFVTHQYDLASLERPGDANVLNGIALTDTPNEIWVTGKLWPTMYRIRLL